MRLQYTAPAGLADYLAERSDPTRSRTPRLAASSRTKQVVHIADCRDEQLTLMAIRGRCDCVELGGARIAAQCADAEGA